MIDNILNQRKILLNKANQRNFYVIPLLTDEDKEKINSIIDNYKLEDIEIVYTALSFIKKENLSLEIIKEVCKSNIEVAYEIEQKTLDDTAGKESFLNALSQYLIKKDWVKHSDKISLDDFLDQSIYPAMEEKNWALKNNLSKVRRGKSIRLI